MTRCIRPPWPSTSEPAATTASSHSSQHEVDGGSTRSIASGRSQGERGLRRSSAYVLLARREGGRILVRIVGQRPGAECRDPLHRARRRSGCGRPGAPVRAPRRNRGIRQRSATSPRTAPSGARGVETITSIGVRSATIPPGSASASRRANPRVTRPLRPIGELLQPRPDDLAGLIDVCGHPDRLQRLGHVARGSDPDPERLLRAGLHPCPKDGHPNAFVSIHGRQIRCPPLLRHHRPVIARITRSAAMLGTGPMRASI